MFSHHKYPFLTSATSVAKLRRLSSKVEILDMQLSKPSHSSCIVFNTAHIAFTKNQQHQAMEFHEMKTGLRMQRRF